MHNAIAHHPLTDAQPARKLEGHKKLGGDTARAADPKWPMGFSIPCDVPSSLETGKGGAGICRSGTGWVVSNCPAHHLYISILLLLLLSFY